MDCEILKLADEYSSKLNEIDAIKKNIEKINVAFEVIYTYNFDKSTEKKMEYIFDTQMFLCETLTKELDEIRKKMDDYRKNCKHNFVLKCMGGHKDLYECSKCGKTENY